MSSFDITPSINSASPSFQWGIQFYGLLEKNLPSHIGQSPLPPMPRPVRKKTIITEPLIADSAPPAKRRRGRPPIVDKFTGLQLSRQRKWQLRKATQGLCVLCGKPALSTSHCLDHMEKNRENNARRFGFKKQYQNCKSRQLKQLLNGEANQKDGKSFTQENVISVRELGLTELDQQREYLVERGAEGWELIRAEVRQDDILWHLRKTIQVPHSAFR